MRVEESYDVVVCGGGLAGFCAALASARLGARTCLVHNRPVLGGNSSSEIGVTPHGAAAFHAYARETGILSEALIEERRCNHAEIYENGWTNSVWDMVLYDLATREERLTVLLNTDVRDVVMDPASALPDGRDTEPTAERGYDHRPCLLDGPGRIAAIRAVELHAERERVISGRVFIDCTGDGLVADRAGCEWRMGSEGRSDFGEPHAPPEPSRDTMGNSIHFLTRDVGVPCEYRAPDWAVRHDDASFFYDRGRLPKEARGGFWWLEIGVPYHTIYDNETIRHELTRHALGVWDWMKNRDPVMRERTRTRALDWIGQVPGKRESRRVAGLYLMCEGDLLERVAHEDEIAFGGWFVDLHTPGGLLAETSEPTSAEGNHDTFAEYSVLSYCGPYGLPLRSLVSRDIENLLLAGRNVSVTRATLGTMRVMGTTALLGQAAGTAAAKAITDGLALRQLVAGEAVGAIRQRLLRDGCFLPNAINEDPSDLARSASVSASSSGRLVGAGPRTRGVHDGLGIWRDQPQYDSETLAERRGQLIALGSQGIDCLWVCVSNDSDAPQPVDAALQGVEHIWDYRVDTGVLVGETTLTVPPGAEQWVGWDVGARAGQTVQAGRWLRLDLEANRAIRWHEAGCVIPGHVASYRIGPSKMRRFSNGVTLGFRVEPAQSVWEPAEAISGVTRPHRRTNLWRSDPQLPLPQWLELAWEAGRTIGTVELTFPGHLLREYHAYGPFYLDAQCAVDYDLAVRRGDAWETVLEVRGNYQRHRRHVLDRHVRTDGLRVLVRATGGDPSAAIYEVRCYK